MKFNVDVCKDHPEFDPNYAKIWTDKKNIECQICRYLRHGVRPVGDFIGEFSADDSVIREATVLIGPMSVAEFGYARYCLGLDYHKDDGVPWYVDMKKRMIYIKHVTFSSRFTDFSDLLNIQVEYVCLTELEHERDSDSVSLAIVFENDREIVFSVRSGMTADEVVDVANSLISSLNSVLNQRVVNLKIG